MKPHKKGFFQALVLSGIGHVVLRNYDKIVVNNENDIDIYVSREDLSRIFEILKCHLVGCRFDIRIRSDKFAVVAYYPDEVLSLDIHTSLSYYGMSYINTSRMLEYRIIEKEGIWRLTDESAALIAILNRLLHKRAINDSDLSILCAMKEDSRKLLMEDLVGDSLSQVINSFINGADRLQIRRKFIYLLRSRSFHNIFCEVVFRTKLLFERVYRPRGGLLSLVGTHGAGKSTTIEQLHSELARTGLKIDLRHATSRPGFLPGLTRANDQGQKSASNQQERSLKHIFVHSMRMLYHIADYWVLWFFARKNASTTIYITDRYIYDYLVEPRNTSAIPQWLRSILIAFAPSPNLTAIIWNAPAIIYHRKAERSISELEEEVNAYLSLSKHNHARAYKTDCPPTSLAKSILIDFMNENCSFPQEVN